MSHMRQARGPVSSSLEGYTDTVVDQQYVLIEASPHADVSLIAPTACAVICVYTVYRENLAIWRILPKIAKLKFSGGRNVIAVVATPETPN